MFKKIFICFMIILSLWITQTNANTSELNENNISINIENIFIKYTKNIEKKYSNNTSVKKIEVLLDKLYNIKNTQELSWNKKDIIDDLIKLSNEYIFDNFYKQKTIKDSILIKNFPISKEFWKTTNTNDSIFLENDTWYTYVFEKHLSFKDNYSPTLKDLEFNKIDPRNDLFFINNNKPAFAVEFKKVRLISDNIIYWIPNKYRFLQELRDDKFYLHDYNTDKIILDIKKTSQELTKDISKKEEKIKILYDYVLKNTQYTIDLNLEDKKIFSWIETYKNKSWVCEGYSKLFQYLLYFSDIQDVETMRWYVIDAIDYPTIWHAWVRIRDRYYDPTFDDPIWWLNDREFNQYLYYNLPKDLFYTNRYDYWISQPVLEKSPLSYREQYVKKQLAEVFQKYKWEKYNILKELQFRDDNNLDYYKSLSIEDIFSKINYLEVDNFKIISSNKNITNLQYFELNNENISAILNQINYDLEKYKFMKWKDAEWNISYRIWFNITMQ